MQTGAFRQFLPGWAEPKPHVRTEAPRRAEMTEAAIIHDKNVRKRRDSNNSLRVTIADNMPNSRAANKTASVVVPP
jgi:hypothetical protein